MSHVQKAHRASKIHVAHAAIHTQRSHRNSPHTQPDALKIALRTRTRMHAPTQAPPQTRHPAEQQCVTVIRVPRCRTKNRQDLTHSDPHHTRTNHTHMDGKLCNSTSSSSSNSNAAQQLCFALLWAPSKKFPPVGLLQATPCGVQLIVGVHQRPVRSPASTAPSSGSMPRSKHGRHG